MTKRTPPPIAALKPEDAQLLAQLVQLGLENLAGKASAIIASLPVEVPPPAPPAGDGEEKPHG